MKIEQRFSVHFSYDIVFTQNVFDLKNKTLSEVLTKEQSTREVKVAFAIDRGLYACHPSLISSIEAYIASQEGITLACTPRLVTGGEQTKNSAQELMNTLALINEAKIDRHAFLVGIGGGAALDMIGFAAAVGHRGIRHVRIPTTVLSQNDSGVGVKNGINCFGKKNFIGTFTPPYAVINDCSFLTTLHDRDWRSGSSEAVKAALIKDKSFFEWLEEHALAINERDMEAMKVLVQQCAKLHMDHIAASGDPFELGSSRPLDFGHWAAHKLEQLTAFEIKHGEAVAIGIALDIVYGMHTGFMDEESVDRVLSVLSDLGFELFHPLLLDESGAVLNPELTGGLEEFREHLGGELTITMVAAIGEKFDVHEMDISKIEQAALTLQQKQASSLVKGT